MLAIARQGTMSFFAYSGRRLKVESRSPVIAKPGNRRTYTSGWAKNQNMWSQSSGPPWVEVKNTVQNARSATKRLSADTKAGNAQSIRRLVKIQAHVNSGSFMRDIPGARRRKIVTRKFTVDTMLDAMRSMSASPMIEPPTAGLNSTVFSGAYVVHPQSAVPPPAKKLDSARRPLAR